MFGTFTGSGFADLARYDLNQNGVIDASDAVFAKLQVWVDTNGDGVTDPGKLHRLDELGIKSLSLAAKALGGTTSGGATLRAASSFTYADGTVQGVYEAILPTDQADTVYRGEAAPPPGPGRTSRMRAALASSPTSPSPPPTTRRLRTCCAAAPRR